jgi:hypothetical protein
MFGALHNGPQGAVMPILMVALIALGAFGLIGLMLTLAVTLEQRKANEKQPGSGKVS